MNQGEQDIDQKLRELLPDRELPEGFDARLRNRLLRPARPAWFQPGSFALGALTACALFVSVLGWRGAFRALGPAKPLLQTAARVQAPADRAEDLGEILEILSEMDRIVNEEGEYENKG